MDSRKLIFLVFLGLSLALPGFGQPSSLTYRPLDVDYSASMDRLIMISASPNTLHIYNTATNAEVAVVLPAVPTSVSVSPDGLHAAVALGTSLSYVNLTTASIEKSLTTTAPSNFNRIILAGNGYIYGFRSSYDIRSVQISSGAETVYQTYSYGGYPPALHPDGKAIYWTSGSNVYKADISQGAVSAVTMGNSYGCYNTWHFQNGKRFLTGCGNLFRASDIPTDDMIPNGTLSNAHSATGAADSAAAGRLAVIPMTSYTYVEEKDTYVQFYDDTYLQFLGKLTFPILTVNSKTYSWHGKFVFFNPQGTKVYTVLQADSSAQLTNDYAVYPIALDNSSACSPSLSASTASMGAGGGDASVDITANADCVWQASTSVSWLALGVGGISTGSGRVTITAAPNLQNTSRTGVVTIAGLTYTVDQAAGSAPTSNFNTPLAIRPIQADYSSSLDRIIVTTGGPSALRIINPVTLAQTVVPLALPPLSLSISVDGLHAAVGHDGWISYVNLSTGVVEKNLATSLSKPTVALGESYIYLGTSDYYSARYLNLATGTETLWPPSYTYGLRVHPSGKYLYSSGYSSYNRYDIAGGIPGTYTAYSDYGYYNCPSMWFSEDGTRLFSSCGGVLRLFPGTNQDMKSAGALWGSGTGTASVSDSAAATMTAAIPSTPSADTAVTFFSREYQLNMGMLPIPKLEAGPSKFATHGRNVFWNKAGDQIYVIGQADPSAPFYDDYVLFRATLNSGCNGTLSANSALVGASKSTGFFTLNETADCLWQARSTVPWIAFTQNAIGSGSASVGYWVDANLTASPRSGMITVAGKVFTILQDAGAAGTPLSLNVLPFRPIDAAYSKGLDRIIIVSAGPNRLNLFDPMTGSNTPIALNASPKLVALTPDGLHAAVAHDDSISILNLQTRVVERTILITGTVTDLQYAANGYVYVVYNDNNVSSINIAIGAETKINYYFSALRLNPPGNALYGLASSLYRFTISSGAMAYDRYIYPPNGICSNMWFLNDGRLLDKCGKAYNTSAVAANDGTSAGSLSGLSGNLSSTAHSSQRGMIASVADTSSTEDGRLYLNDQTYLAMTGKLTLPKFPGPATVSSTGRYAFWDSTGSRLYVILQAVPSGGVLNDFAVFLVAPSSTPSCSVTLGTPSASIAASGGTGNVAITATSGCIWEASTSASWLSITNGTLGVGIGNVGYSVLPNQAQSARTATITVDGQVFTITQAAGLVLSAPANIQYTATWGNSYSPHQQYGITEVMGRPVSGLSLGTSGVCNFFNSALTSTLTPSVLDLYFVTNMAPGVYNCSLIISGTGGSPSAAAVPATISVTLTLNPIPFLASSVPVGTMRYLAFENHTPFGYFAYMDGSSIIYHNDLGYLSMIDANDGGGVYMYDHRSRHWWYSSRSSFPFLYDFTLNCWIYYFPIAGQSRYTYNPRYFANMNTSQVFSM